MRMNASAKVLNAGQAGQPRETNSSALKAVTAPNPTLLSAAPTPGTQTAAMTLRSPVRTCAVDGTRPKRSDQRERRKRKQRGRERNAS